MHTSSPPPLPEETSLPPSRRGWWQRHWKWAVPLLALGLVALFAGAIFALFSTVMGAMRDNDAYRIAVAQARADRTVIAALGTPIEPGWMMTGQMNSGEDGGYARFEIPVEGPRGRATVFVEAHSRLGVWKFATLAATVEGSATPIDLLPGLPPDRRLTEEEAAALPPPDMDDY